MLFQHIPWLTFLLVMLVLVALYYLIVLGMYYVPYWTRKTPVPVPAAELFQTDGPEMPSDDDPVVASIDLLIRAVKEATSAEPGGHAALGQLRGRLKEILQSFPDLAASPHRPAINELIVSECEKHGRALLSEAEVDQWWLDPKLLAPLPGPAPLPEGWPR